MKAEKTILFFIAIIVGLVAAGVAFYLYQATKTIPQSKIRTITTVTPSPTPKANGSVVLALASPADEQVFDKRTITVSGKTDPEAVILISSGSNDQVITPATNGDFNATTTIDDNVSIITITAIAPNGEESKITRTVTFTSESF